MTITLPPELVLGAERAPHNPDMGHDGAGMTHWACTLSNDSIALRFHYSMGSACRIWKRAPLGSQFDMRARDEARRKAGQRYDGPGSGGGQLRTLHDEEVYDTLSEPQRPTLSEVISCLMTDAARVVAADTVGQWAADMCEADVDRANRTWNLICGRLAPLRALLGDCFAPLLADPDAAEVV